MTLVIFLGGVTFAEIAALRFLSQQEDGKCRDVVKGIRDQSQEIPIYLFIKKKSKSHSTAGSPPRIEWKHNDKCK